jgi:hypothetical protein
MPGALDRSVGQYLTRRQWHCLMCALVVQRRDLVSTPDQADALSRFEGNGERPEVRDRAERNRGQGQRPRINISVHLMTALNAEGAEDSTTSI